MTKATTNKKAIVRKVDRVDKMSADPPKKRAWRRKSEFQKQMDDILSKASKVKRAECVKALWTAGRDPSPANLKTLCAAVTEFHELQKRKTQVL